MNPSLIIDCNTCVMQHTSACDDCMVTYLCEHEPDDCVVIDLVELRAVKLLSEAGLIPELRHRVADPPRPPTAGPTAGPTAAPTALSS